MASRFAQQKFANTLRGSTPRAGKGSCQAVALRPQRLPGGGCTTPTGGSHGRHSPQKRWNATDPMCQPRSRSTYHRLQGRAFCEASTHGEQILGTLGGSVPSTEELMSPWGPPADVSKRWCQHVSSCRFPWWFCFQNEFRSSHSPRFHYLGSEMDLCLIFTCRKGNPFK